MRPNNTNVAIAYIHTAITIGLIHQVNQTQLGLHRQMSTRKPSQPTKAVSPLTYRLLLSTYTVAVYYYYSARKLVLIYRFRAGGRHSSRLIGRCKVMHDGTK